MRISFTVIITKNDDDERPAARYKHQKHCTAPPPYNHRIAHRTKKKHNLREHKIESHICGEESSQPPPLFNTPSRKLAHARSFSHRFSWFPSCTQPAAQQMCCAHHHRQPHCRVATSIRWLALWLAHTNIAFPAWKVFIIASQTIFPCRVSSATTTRHNRSRSVIQLCRNVDTGRMLFLLTVSSSSSSSRTLLSRK